MGRPLSALVEGTETRADRGAKIYPKIAFLNGHYKIYTQAPLPFMGQKRRWNDQFKTALRNEFGDCTTFVDLFGGSGLLSHFTHTVRPDARVIYNDFDNYTGRLEAIPATNALLAELRTILCNYPRNKRIVEPYRTRVLDAIARYDRAGFVDYISLSASILFSSNYVTSLAALRKEHLYNTVRLSDFNADGYLDGLTVTSKDYRELFAEYVSEPHVCFLIDPPYLSTQALTYEGYIRGPRKSADAVGCLWRLSDYLDVLHTLNGINYFYFTSDKSSIVELCAWLDREHRLANPFCGATRIEQTTNLNYNSRYTDIMLYRHINAQNNVQPITNHQTAA